VVCYLCKQLRVQIKILYMKEKIFYKLVRVATELLL